MNHGRDEPSHEAVVDAWLARSVDHDSSVELVRPDSLNHQNTRTTPDPS